MARPLLSDQQWEKIRPSLPSETGHNGRPYTTGHRTTIEGILWIARTGAPWRDLPPEFGKWNTVYRRFNRWVRYGVFDTIFQSLNEVLDLGLAMVDGTFVKVHQHGTGTPKGVARLMLRARKKQSGVVKAG